MAVGPPSRGVCGVRARAITSPERGGHNERTVSPVPSTALDVAAVYREHFDYVVTNLRRLGVPTPALEDACHDVFLVVHRRARSGGVGRDAMRPWLYGVARRVAADVRRSGARHRRRMLALQSVARPEPGTDEVVGDRRLVQTFLDALDADKRDVFILVELEEMTGLEVARVLGINANTAAARLRAARKIFADHLEATAGAEHEARILAAARRRDELDASTRARVWVGLAPVLHGKGLSTLLFGAAAGAVLVATTAIVAGRGPQVTTATSSIGSREGVDRADAGGRPHDVEPALIPASLVPATLPRPIAPALASAKPSIRETSEAPAATSARPPSTIGTDAAPGDLQAQTELAGRVLRASEPAIILGLVDEYRARFSDGFFADRVSARRIEALCDRQQRELASREHAALARRQPALADRAFDRCAESSDHETDAVRPSEG